MKNIRFQCLPGFYIFLAVAMIVIPIRWVIAWLIAALVHELFHFVFLILLGVKITLVELDLSGASIHTDALSGLTMVICALAGPLGSALLLLLIRVAPRVAICGLIQFTYNLLPVYPLDGGRAFRGLSEYLFHRKIKQAVLVWENVMLVLLAGTAVWVSFALRAGLFPIICTSVLIYKNKKIPCKERRLRVQ